MNYLKQMLLFGFLLGSYFFAEAQEDPCEKLETVSAFAWAYYYESPDIYALPFVPDNICYSRTITWDFGDGTSCVQGSDCIPPAFGWGVSHTYEDCGTYNLCMTVEADCPMGPMCVFEKCELVEITENCGPSPCEELEDSAVFIWDFNGSPTEIFAYGEVSENICGIPEVTWDFGDGTSCIQNEDCPTIFSAVLHTYEECGIYDLCMQVEALCGEDEVCTFETCQEVVVELDCTPCDITGNSTDFTWATNGSNLDIAFTSDVPDVLCNINQIEWDFGDGTPICIEGAPDGCQMDGDAVLHEYADCGTYTVCMQVYGVCWFDPHCEFQICKEVVVDGCEPTPCEKLETVSEFVWEYYYESPDIYALPFVPNNICHSRTITWDFGDGTSCVQGDDCIPPAFGWGVSHTYEDCGTYNLCMLVEADCPEEPECTFERCKEVEIIGCDPCDVFVENTEIEVIQEGSVIHFRADVFEMPYCPIFQVSWDYGNGEGCVEGTDCQPSTIDGFFIYDYVECGTYELSVTVFNECCAFTVPVTVVVEEDCAPPCSATEPALEIKILSAGLDHTYELLVDGASCAINQIEWFFGDGTSCIEGDCPQQGGLTFHHYEDCGTYLIQAFATDICGCTYEESRYISICKFQDPGSESINKYQLKNSPNPFKEQTTISYHLDADQAVNLSVIDIDGKVTDQLLIQAFQQKGFHEMTYDTKELPEGVYFCVLEGVGFSEVLKLVKVD